MKTSILVFAALAFASMAAAADRTLVWQDEFNQAPGSGPDAAKWVYDLGKDKWGNRELETYTDSRANVFVATDPAATDGKVLVLRAVKAADGSYTSGLLKTLGKFTARFGRFEARIKMPRGKGIWPAFWMLGENIAQVKWPTCGEIDIIESLGDRPGIVYGTAHGPGYSGGHGIQGRVTLPPGEALADGYHVYAVEWSPGKVEWSFDGRVYHTITPAQLPLGTRWVYDDSPFFILLNLAVGGYWPGYPDATTQFPQEMRIDYVRVYAPAAVSKP